MNYSKNWHWAFGTSLLVAGCVLPDYGGGETGMAGHNSSGGVTGRSAGAPSNGGAIHSGGAQVGSGGSNSSGGTQIQGGSTANGGTVPIGGGPQGSGGMLGSGGIFAPNGGAATGGTTPTGGTKASGGSLATGGFVATGGATANGGTVATGGNAAVGGNVATGGAKGVGGAVATGGAPATGGTLATGGSSFSNTGGTLPGSGGACPAGGAAGSGGLLNCNPGVLPCAQGQYAGAPSLVSTDTSQQYFLWSLAPGSLLGSRYVLNPGLVISSLGVFTSLSGSVPAGAFQLALYMDNKGVPGSLIFATDDIQASGTATVCSNNSATVTTFANSDKYTVPANVYYFWIMLRVTGVSSIQVVSVNSGSQQLTGCSTSASAASWPSQGPSPFPIAPSCASGSSSVGVVPYLFAIAS
jgi:hypothetical protein